MAHPNIDKRREKVKVLMKNGRLKKKHAAQLADEFGCSLSAIRADVVRFRHNETGGYHVSALKRKILRMKYNETCQYCGRKADNLVAEHIVPAAQGGKANMGNLTLACQSCNMKKRVKDGTKLII